MSAGTIERSVRRLDIDAPLALWLVDLDGVPEDDAAAALSTRELHRAGRFHFARDRDRYLIAHIALRRLIEEHAGIPVRCQRFVDGNFGKWRLVDAGGWHFNLSYAGGTALIGLSAEAEIGVDIEQTRPIEDGDELAALHFAPSERAALARLAVPVRNDAFVRCWTRKEAGLKALGAGLNLDLTTLETGVSDARTIADCSLGTVEIGSFIPADGFVASWARLF